METRRCYSQSVIKLPRAVLVHIGGVGEVLVGCGHVDVLPSEHRLSDVERRLHAHTGGQGERGTADRHERNRTTK